jgi:hypothetical protein
VLEEAVGGIARTVVAEQTRKRGEEEGRGVRVTDVRSVR